MQRLKSSDLETVKFRQDFLVTRTALRTLGLSLDLLQRFVVEGGLAGSYPLGPFAVKKEQLPFSEKKKK